jgi:hypothetical protein
VPKFGNRPDDVLQDHQGNAVAGVAIVCYASEADASSQTSSLGTAVSGADGRWPLTINGYDQVWARDPNGNVWAVASDSVISNLATTYPAKSFLGYEMVSVANDYNALQAAASNAVTNSTRLVASGTITTSSTLTLNCDADLAGLTINYTGTGTAVVVGATGSANFRKRAVLPKVIATAKTVNGWAQVAGSVGVDVVNAYAWHITVPYVQNFETNLRVRGASSNGTQQSTFMLGHLDNGKVNIRFTGDATGWANQNYFFGGRCSHNSNEGSQVAGTRHVLFENLANPVNGNSFYGTSLESPDVVEYHIEAANSLWNVFYGGRYENTGGDTHRRLLSSGNAKGNRLNGGAYAENVTQTVTSPAQPFDIDSNAMTTRHGGTSTMSTMLLENAFSNTAPILTMMAAGAGTAGSDPTTAYVLKATANTWTGKRSTDTNERLIMDWQNGRIYVGAGNATSTRYFGNLGTSMGFDGASIGFVTDNTYDFGIASLRPRYIRAGTAVQTGAFATASRPAASTAGAGASYFDTTLNKPAWSDGTNWRDATGTIV